MENQQIWEGNDSLKMMSLAFNKTENPYLLKYQKLQPGLFET